MKITIAGGTGFVGKALMEDLLKNKHEVIILTRRLKAINETTRIRYVQWLSEDSSPLQALEGTDIFINLAGESINSGRWTEKRKDSKQSLRVCSYTFRYHK